MSRPGPALDVLEESDLAMNLLSFRMKNFSFERSIEIDGSRYALFHRTETESESKLRPKLLTMWLVAPWEWLIYDEAEDAVLLGRDGATPGPHMKGTAIEAAAEPARFEEQGLSWERESPGPSTYLYLPAERIEQLRSPLAREALGPLVGPDPGRGMSR
jgi:hypothetical protein